VPSAAVGKAFADGFYVFADGFGHSAKDLFPVVTGSLGDDAVTAEPSVADVEAAAGSRVRGEGAGDGAGGGAPRRLGEVEVEPLRGAERQMRRHREERTCVRAPSPVGRSVTMSPRTSSGRPLMRSATTSCSRLLAPSSSWLS
jgi:hypothetical protein